MENPSTNKQGAKNAPSNKSRPRGKKRNSPNPAKNTRRQSTFGKSGSAPSARSVRSKVVEPIQKSLNNGKTTRVSHTEFLGNFNATNFTQFTYQNRLRLNPASFRTFPWLSQIAKNFETYRFRKLKFHFKTRSPTSTSGSVIMSPDYDAQDGQPSEEKLLTMMAGTVEDAPWKDITCVLDPTKMNRAYQAHFCMEDSRFNASKQDEKTIDCGQIFFAYDNIGGLFSNWGKIFVEYEVDLHTPQPSNLSVDEGGLRSAGQVALMQPGAQPFLAQSIITQLAEDPILKPWGDAFPGSFPTGNFGIFTKDYEGLIETVVGGTGITGMTAPIVTQNGSGLPAVINKLNTLINSAGTIATRTDWIRAFAGDYIGLGSNTASTITSLNSLMAGSANF